MVLSEEERKERKRAYMRSYYESHKDKISDKRKARNDEIRAKTKEYYNLIKNVN